MKKTLSRTLSLCLILALTLSLTLFPASAASQLGSVTIGEVTFTVTGDSLAVGSQLTLAPQEIPQDAQWHVNIHLNKDGVDRYSLITQEGMTEFFLSSQISQYTDLLNIPASETRTFTLAIPEEYADWSVAIRFGYNNSFAEIPLEETEDVSFTDVHPGDWFYNFVIPAANGGWFSGNPDGTFNPSGNLTLAEAMVLAVRLKIAQTGQSLPQAQEGQPWYQIYYDFCTQEGLLPEGNDYLSRINSPATRFEMVAILDPAAYEPRVNGSVNQVADGFIPDLSESDPYGEIVYRWYRSGVLTGDVQNKFNGPSNITRAEACVIICHLTALVEAAVI